MDKDRNVEKGNKRKGLLAPFVEKIDKKMREKARNIPYSCGSKDGDNSCCS